MRDAYLEDIAVGQLFGSGTVGVTVHMRVGLAALAACQSKLAWMPCGPLISTRGRGR